MDMDIDVDIDIDIEIYIDINIHIAVYAWRMSLVAIGLPYGPYWLALYRGILYLGHTQVENSGSWTHPTHTASQLLPMTFSMYILAGRLAEWLAGGVVIVWAGICP